MADPRAVELIEQGRAALLEGDKPRAQALLLAATRRDPLNDEAWLWLAGTYADPAAMARCLQRAVALNPANHQARDGLLWLQAQHGVIDTTPEPLPAVAMRVNSPVAARTSASDRGALADALLIPFVAGALLGLTRLTGWLQPSPAAWTGDLSSWAAALRLVVALAVSHGLALMGASALFTASSQRMGIPGSLTRWSRTWQPALLWTGALALALLGLRLGARGWAIAATLAWLVIVAGLALVARRWLRLLHAATIPAARLAGTLAAMLVATIALLALAGPVARTLAG